MEKSNLKVLASVKALLAVLGPAESVKGGWWEGSATADSITTLRTFDASFQAELDRMKRGEIPAYRLADDTGCRHCRDQLPFNGSTSCWNGEAVPDQDYPATGLDQRSITPSPSVSCADSNREEGV